MKQDKKCRTPKYEEKLLHNGIETADNAAKETTNILGKAKGSHLKGQKDIKSGIDS